jgi:ABC-type transporter Mla subunit MlaD
MSERRDPRAAERRDLWLGLAVLAALGIVAYLSTVALSGGPLRGGTPVRVALPADGPILRPGAEVRIGGERAGDVKSVSLDRAARRAIATLRLDRGTVGAGASARVRLRGMAGAVYVELDPGDPRHPLPSGRVIAARPAVQLTDVVAAFDRDTRRGLSRTLRAVGGGLQGQGTTLQRTLQTAPGALTEVTPLLQALAVPGELHGLLGSLTQVSDAATPADDLGRSVPLARQTFAALAVRSGAVGEALKAAPPLERSVAAVLPDANRLLARAGSAARELQPAVGALARSLPALRRVATRTPQLAALDTLGRQALPALHAVAPLVPLVRGPAAGLAATTPALSELASYLVPYKRELVEAPAGFDRWGGFRYNVGAGAGHRAVRFSMIFSCAHARDAYPAPGKAGLDRKACP